MIKCGQEAIAPVVVEKAERLAGQITPPVAQVGAEKIRARPVSRSLSPLDMTADHFFICTDSGEMAVRA